MDEEIIKAMELIDEKIIEESNIESYKVNEQDYVLYGK